MRRYTKPAVVVTALGALGLAAFGTGAADAAGTVGGHAGSGSSPRITAESASWNHGTAQVNKRVMQRFTSEFLPTGDPALARKFISPNIVMHFGGTTQQGRDTYLGIVAANMRAFPDLKWTVEDMRAEGDTVAIRYTMTGTHEGPFAGVEATGKKIHAESFAFYRLSHGKIVEERAQLDMLGILTQMGAIPAA
ncbi:ester cyclase [Streptomyces griseiscabiei]|uniref:Ester cyclase n=1 Tax=Streptomyces griseiscabiei TaxID=2993540 RepID=A0ABU4L417_9ACTN|nr:ester cyclase [Streptomyces griseiscabiei]MBZ3905415.1 ester cyclase [Streptomyces griseiscabiei]MDX2910504.1 ester cyclase [Streptomyces griseiscabiei]